MQDFTEITLERDCPATVIPDGVETTLPSGETVVITQALGGSVTVRARGGLYRIAPGDHDALGKTVADQLRSRNSTPAGQQGDEGPFSEAHVWEALKQCFDPEIPVNIVDLGLIYDLRLAEGSQDGRHSVDVKMTLTAQGCGMGPAIAADAQSKIEALPEVNQARVEIVWDPQWTPQMISPEGRKMLGLD